MPGQLKPIVLRAKEGKHGARCAEKTKQGALNPIAASRDVFPDDILPDTEGEQQLDVSVWGVLVRVGKDIEGTSLVHWGTEAAARL